LRRKGSIKLKNAQPKRRGRRPTGKGKQVVVRLQPQLLAAVDAWIAEQDPPKPTRAEALRRFAAKTLKVKS
jgi:cytochrome c553